MAEFLIFGSFGLRGYHPRVHVAYRRGAIIEVHYDGRCRDRPSKVLTVLKVPGLEYEKAVIFNKRRIRIPRKITRKGGTVTWTREKFYASLAGHGQRLWRRLTRAN